MMRPISNRNGIVRYLITFSVEYVLKQNIVRKNDILLILPVKQAFMLQRICYCYLRYHLVTAYYVILVRLTAWPICGVIMHFSQMNRCTS